MNSSEPIVNSLVNRLAEARAELTATETKREQLLADIAALERVVQMYPDGAAPVPKADEPLGLAGLTLGQGLVQIAKENDGILVVVDAKRRLIQEGKLKNNKNAGPRLYSHLSRDHNFERIEAGKFHLVQNSVTPQSLLHHIGSYTTQYSLGSGEASSD